MLKDEKLKDFEKRRLVENFDRVFGLKLSERDEIPADIPAEVMEMVNKREEMRKSKQWAESDALRKEIEKLGYKVSDFFQSKDGWVLRLHLMLRYALHEETRPPSSSHYVSYQEKETPQHHTARPANLDS